MSPASPSILESLLAPVDGGHDDDEDDANDNEDGDDDDYDIVKAHLLHLPEVESCSSWAGPRSNSCLHWNWMIVIMKRLTNVIHRDDDVDRGDDNDASDTLS